MASSRDITWKRICGYGTGEGIPKGLVDHRPGMLYSLAGPQLRIGFQGIPEAVSKDPYEADNKVTTDQRCGNEHGKTSCFHGYMFTARIRRPRMFR